MGGLRAKRRQFAEELPAIRRVCVVGLVIAEVIPNGWECAYRLIEPHIHIHTLRALLRVDPGRNQEKSHDTANREKELETPIAHPRPVDMQSLDPIATPRFINSGIILDFHRRFLEE